MATTTFCSLLVPALVASSAHAQDAAATATPKQEEVVVTGSILRKKNFTSISPLTVITTSDLEKRGVTTIESAVQNVAGNNGGAMNNNWSAGGNFAAGASGISLRGLTTNSTLVLVDGLRMAYYPLADDATRNFVDLNTIPAATIESVQVLQDGASSTYGSDAIAGVVNVITKKNFKGLTGKVTLGAAEHDGGGVTAVSGIWGKGDLNTDGYNFYISAEYEKKDILLAKDAGYPYNTSNQSGYCGTSVAAQSTWSTTPNIDDLTGRTCRTNSVLNGLQFSGQYAGLQATTVAMVRPYTSANASAGNWQILNTAAGCRDLTAYTITTANLPTAVAGVPAGTTVCQADPNAKWNTISPEDTRTAFSARLTKKLGDSTEGYISYNFYQNETYYTGRGGPRTINSVATPGEAGTAASLAAQNGGLGIMLPVYVCPVSTVGACTSSNGTLNPNNPFAAAGNKARISYLFGDIPFYTETKSTTFRTAAGLSGSADGWDYKLDVTYMLSKLDYNKYGAPNLQHILDVVKDGSYNFVDPSKNSQAVRDYVAPPSFQKADSELGMIQASASKPLMDLAGGPLQLGVGAAMRYERVNNPSANPDKPGANSFDRYSSAINPFGAVGFRTVTSAYFELSAPFIPNLDVNLSGRYDSYSTHFANFSPKIGASYKFLDKLTVRSAFSKGFRAPSIAENNSDPSTGFVTLTAPASFLALHNNNGYGSPYSVGLTTVAAKDLKPESSENFSGGIVFEATKWLGFSVDYYKIHKDNIIAGGDASPAIAAYFAGQPIPAGFTVVAGAPDPLLPAALPTPGFVQYTLINLSAQDVAGIDFAVASRLNLGPVKWTSSAEASYVQYYTQTYPDGTKQRYDGTLGNNQITSGSGTPKWKSNWTNTFEYGPATLAATLYYVSGMKSIAADNGDDYYGTCAEGHTAALYRDGATVVKCDIDSFTSLDLHGSYKVNKNYTLYLDVANALGEKAPYDPSGTYGISYYNPAFTSSGMMGRYYKIGAKFSF